MDTPLPFEFDTLRELFLRSTSIYADRPFCQFVDDPEPILYRDFADRIKKVSDCLCAYGIGNGAKVAILSENMPNWPIAFFAAVAFNRVAVPLLCGSSSDEVASFLEHSEARAVFVSRKQLPKICKGHFDVIIITDDLSVHKSAANPDKAECLQAPAPESLAAIIYTSGTSGHPKGVMLSHKNLCHSVLEAKHAQAADTTDRWLSILPSSHAYELAFGLLYPLLAGGSVQYIKGLPSPSTLFPALRKVRPTIMLAVPLIAEKMYKGIQQEVAKSKVLSWMQKHLPALFYAIIGKVLKQKTGGAFRFFGIGGAKLNPETETFLNKCRFPYAIGYGLTETAPLLCNALVGNTYVGSTGTPAYGVEVRLHDVNPETGEGEIIARGPNLMAGYYKEPELTAEVIDSDGWFHTGDLGCKDKKGRFFIKGRLKNVILGASGENIYPEEIEHFINSYPGVNESLVVERGTRLVALVYMEEKLKEPLSVLGKKIQDHINKRVNSFSRLSRVEFVKEPFQKTATAKIKRFLYTQSAPTL